MRGGSLIPGRGQGGTVVLGRRSHAVQEENLDLLIHSPINQQSRAVAFACREESIRRAWRNGVNKFKAEQESVVASCRSEGWEEAQPLLSCTLWITTALGKGSRRPRAWGSQQEHYLIPRQWLRAAVSPLHAKPSRSVKLLQSIEEASLAHKRKGMDTKCRERHIIVPACTSSIHVATHRGDHLPSAGMLFLLSRKNAAYSCFRCAPSPSLLCAVTSEHRGKEAHLGMEHKGTTSYGLVDLNWLHNVEPVPEKWQLKKEPILHQKYSSSNLQISCPTAGPLGSLCRVMES